MPETNEQPQTVRTLQPATAESHLKSIPSKVREVRGVLKVSAAHGVPVPLLWTGRTGRPPSRRARHGTRVGRNYPPLWASVVHRPQDRSALDREKVGTLACVEHWSTEGWVACYAIGNGPVQIWRPGSPVPMDLTAHVCAGGPIVSPETSFERAVWLKFMAPRHGWPEPRVEQWHCIAALSAAMALPRKLEEAAKVVGLSFEQGLLDSQLIRRLGRPGAPRNPLRSVRRCRGPAAGVPQLSLQQGPAVPDGPRLARRPRNCRARHRLLHPRPRDSTQAARKATASAGL
jgi:hypothetical protein